jgi:hypothetical protein
MTPETLYGILAFAALISVGLIAAVRTSRR